MRLPKISIDGLMRAFSAAIALAVLIAGTPANAAGPQYRAIYTYSGASTGGLIMDSAGNLYGTDEGGKVVIGVCGFGCGSVFELSLQPGGWWKRTTLYQFRGGDDGWLPGGRLTFDNAGNLYGVTSQGGAYGAGVVFELSPSGTGSWTETVLHAFTGGADGAEPQAGVTLDSAGNVYGVTFNGSFVFGTVFELSPAGGGVWNETTLHSFTYGTDGGYPDGTLTFDAAGNLYGTTTSGGDASCPVGVDGCGVVFEFTPSGSGWNYNVIFTFNGTNGASPTGQLVFDESGNLYGSTAVGGLLNGCDGSGCGTVYELSPQSGGVWKQTILHAFQGLNRGYDGAGGAEVSAGVIRDSAGNLYGTAYYGGSSGGDGNGVVFKLTPSSSGPWKELVLYKFAGGSTGGSPLANVTVDSAGNLFGTTRFGGNLTKCVNNNFGLGCGVAFEIKP